MPLPEFNGFSLQDETYITKNITFRHRAKRNIESAVITRRMGKKMISDNFGEKQINIKGIILADTPSELLTACDNLKKNLSAVEGNLVITNGRTYTATALSIDIPDQPYTQTMVPFDVDFISNLPYSESELQTAGFLVPSGVNITNVPITISGTVSCRPVITFTTVSGAGDSGVIAFSIKNQQTDNTVLISGLYNRDVDIAFNYDAYQVTVDNTQHDYVGQFDDMEVGGNTLQVVVSGTNDGTQGLIEYKPRYW